MNKLSYIFYAIACQKLLALLKTNQKETFLDLSAKYCKMVEGLAPYDISQHLTERWNAYAKLANKALCPAPPFNFLNVPPISAAMFVTVNWQHAKEELSRLEKIIPRSRLGQLLQEDYVGKPLILNAKYMTSNNSIHHLYNLTHFSNTTGCKLAALRSIVEWGGGYGGMAKIVRRLNKSATYTIIDIPLFSCLQWLYLATVLGSENVNILVSASDEVVPGKINCAPVCLLPNISLEGELFVSTYALSESSRYSQDMVVARNWFSAKHLLLAYVRNSSDFPDSERIGRLAEHQGAAVRPSDFAPTTHFYAFL